MVVIERHKHMRNLLSRATAMKQVMLTILAWGMYIAAFIPLYPLVGSTVTTLTTLPVVVTGWLWGRRAGTLAGVLAFPLNVLLVTSGGDSGWNTLAGRGLPSTLLIVLVGAVVGQIRDLAEEIKRELAERKQAEGRLQQRNRELAMLNRASQALSATLDLDQVLSTVLEEARHLMGVVACSVWLIDPATDELVCRQASGFQSHVVRGWRLPPGAGIAGWVARHGVSQIIPDAQKDEHHFKEVDRQTGLTTRSILSIPLQVKQDVIGVLQVTDIKIDRFHAADLTLLELLAASAAIAIDNARLVDALRQRTITLEARNEELKSFTYVASHNLRAPLVNLMGFATELERAFPVLDLALNTTLPYLDEGTQRAVTIAQRDVPEALEFINTSATRMNHLINGLLELSRLGRCKLYPEQIDMEQLTQTILESMAYHTAEHQAKVSVDHLPQVTADRAAMELIMSNLLTNALLYLVPDRPGEIEISAESHSDATLFHIRDNGRGIAEEDIHKIFTPFQRVGRPDVPGEGLGLAYVQTLIRRHGGLIWCESKPGVGTTFTFTISNNPSQAEGNDHV
jgi:signal transduction histidine kinase